MFRLVDKLSESKILGSVLSVVSITAIWITTVSVNTCCSFIAHEVELPEEAKSLRKF